MSKAIKAQNPLIVIKVKVGEKSELSKLAEGMGLQLTPFCRMILLRELKHNNAQ